MDKIDLRKKLLSRKFWLALIGFITPLLLAFGMSDAQVNQATSIIMSAGVLISYIIGEGLIDANHVSNDDKESDEEIEG